MGFCMVGQVPYRRDRSRVPQLFSFISGCRFMADSTGFSNRDIHHFEKSESPLVWNSARIGNGVFWTLFIAL
jgi:hypothetical protein